MRLARLTNTRHAVLLALIDVRLVVWRGGRVGDTLSINDWRKVCRAASACRSTSPSSLLRRIVSR